MKNSKTYLCLFIVALCLSGPGCGENKKESSGLVTDQIDLKRGALVLCGPADKQFGTVAFDNSCSEKSKKDFSLAIALLHSFEYDESEKVFAHIVDNDPSCAIAWWGIAMCNYHQVWPSPPTRAELEKGGKAINRAMALKDKTALESDYINSMALFYKDWNSVDHRTRSKLFEKAMEEMYKNYPQEKEVAIFYALALVGTSDPSDKTYANQKKAGEILGKLYPDEPLHPGIVHYLIHSYDYPELATFGLEAARKYASIAPSSAHAQHMPSHIFIRLGLWDESIQSNLVSTNAAKCYADSAGIKGHWDEELHGMDYLVYAYLQKGDNASAKKQVDYMYSIQQVYPVNFKDAYAFAAIPARYYLENNMWKEAASMQLHPAQFPWQNFPWQKSIFHFARLLGSAQSGKIDSAKQELTDLKKMYDTLTVQKDTYKANQVLIQVKAGEAWIKLKEGNEKAALELMRAAADLESKTEKSPVTPGEIIPADELLGDMFMELDQPADALKSYKADLKNHPNRLNGLYGAALAAEKSGDKVAAGEYYRQLISVAKSADPENDQIKRAKSFLAKTRS